MLNLDGIMLTFRNIIPRPVRYYNHCRPSLNDAEDNLSCSPDGAPAYVEQIYDKIVNILRNSADSFIPKNKANFYKILVGPGIK